MAQPTLTVREVLSQIEPLIARTSRGSTREDGFFISCVRAALAKNFELNTFIQAHDAGIHDFAITASLRGVCEDIIALRFIGTFAKQHREEAVAVLMLKSVMELLQEQTKFFEKYRPSQPILDANNVAAEIHNLRLRLRQMRKSYRWKKHREWPSVQEMAEFTHLRPLYDFLYAATSCFVHFSPSNLIRMGAPVQDQLQFSTSNFTEYYHAFNCLYGLFLFITFCTKFSAMLGIREEIRPHIEQLIRLTDEEIRWPELITIEELNLPSVSKMLRVMAHTARKAIEAPAVWEWEDAELKPLQPPPAEPEPPDGEHNSEP
ncbi:MAG TPA: DUF5677 domain-containing protein [Tepidisphaeraceae bacterium]|jgi:hypothetical protein